MTYLTMAGKKVFGDASLPSGNTVANSTNEVAFANSYTIKAGTTLANDCYKIRMWGLFSTTALSPTIRGRVRIGGVAVLDTTAFSILVGVTNGGWWGEGLLTFRSNGSSGLLEAQAFLSFGTAVTAALSVHVVNTSQYTINTTIDQTITMSAQWGAASASNSISLKQLLVEKA